MSHVTIPMVLALMLSLTSAGNFAMAFTLRFGSVSVAEDPAATHHITDTDIPTPRMLNLTVGADQVTLGPALVAPNVIAPESAVSVRGQAPSRVANEPSTPQARRQTLPRQLSGVEIMLLRHTKQVAER